MKKKISKYTNSQFSIALNSGTSALHVACLSIGLKKGDYLWTSAISFVASANCGAYCGAKIDFVDIDLDTFNISISELKKKLKNAKRQKKLPKVLVLVHLAGNPCNLSEIKKLSKLYNFMIIEDASHALGSIYKKSKIGSCKYSDLTVFSFHPVKTITSGEGGIITTNSKIFEKRSKIFREHGIVRESASFLNNKSNLETHYEQQSLGYNYRLSEINAALGLSQIKWIKKFILKRNLIHSYYKKKLVNFPIKFQKINKNFYSSYHLSIILVPKEIRNKLFKELREKKYLVNIHYIPIFYHPFYKLKNSKKNQFLNSEQYYKSAISIPNFFLLTKKDQIRFIKILKNFFKKNYNF